MLDNYYVACRRCSNLPCMSVSCVTLAVICLLILVTTVDAAAVKKTRPVKTKVPVLPADHLEPVHAGRNNSQNLKVDQVHITHNCS